MPSDNTDWWLPVEWIVAGIWIWKAWLKQYLIWSFDLPREENPSFPSVLFSPSSLWWPKLHTLRGSCQTQQGDDQQVQKMLKLCSVMVRAGAGTQADIRADSRLDWTHTHTHTWCREKEVSSGLSCLHVIPMVFVSSFMTSLSVLTEIPWRPAIQASTIHPSFCVEISFTRSSAWCTSRFSGS